MKFPLGSDMYGWERLWAVAYRLIFRYLVCRQDWALLKAERRLDPEIGPFYSSTVDAVACSVHMLFPRRHSYLLTPSWEKIY